MRSANPSAWARMASRCSWSISELSSQNSTSGRKIATTATATMCRKTMRQISDLNVGALAWIPARNPARDPIRATLFLLGHEIADATDGVDHDLGAVLGELLAQPRDVDLDRVGGDLAVEAEDVVLDVLLRHHPPLPAQQDLEDRGLARGDDARLVVDEDLAAFGVIDKVGEAQRAAEQRAGTAQDRLQPRHQLLHRERFCEIVVGAAAQAT